MDPSFVDEPPKLTPHGAETSQLTERCLHGSPEESEAIEWLSSKFGVVQSQGAQTAPMSGQVTPFGIFMESLLASGSRTGMHAFTGKPEIASITQRAGALPGLFACAWWKEGQVSNPESPRYFHLVGLGARRQKIKE